MSRRKIDGEIVDEDEYKVADDNVYNNCVGEIEWDIVDKSVWDDVDKYRWQNYVWDIVYDIVDEYCMRRWYTMSCADVAVHVVAGVVVCIVVGSVDYRAKSAFEIWQRWRGERGWKCCAWNTKTYVWLDIIVIYLILIFIITFLIKYRYAIASIAY